MSNSNIPNWHYGIADCNTKITDSRAMPGIEIVNRHGVEIQVDFTREAIKNLAKAAGLKVSA